MPVVGHGNVPSYRISPPSSPALMAALAAILLAVTTGRQPQVLINHTPSEPTGAYWRTRTAPTVGALVAFAAPPAAFPYADRQLAYLRHEPLLKTLGAGPGDTVCAAGAMLTINTVVRAPIADRDGRGQALPRWRGCRKLTSGELFVFSDRVPNSFDSRYFGPIAAGSVIGVYRRLGGR